MTTDRRLPGAAGQAAVVVAAVVVSALVLGEVAWSERLQDPAATLSISLVAGWSFVAAGLVARQRTGAMMIAVGFVLLAGLLAGSEHSGAFITGVAVAPAAIALFGHLLVGFPTGRLRTRAERGLIAAGYAVAVPGQLLMLLLMDDVRSYQCPCPPNPLLAAHVPALHDAIMVAQRGLGALLALAGAALLARRWRAASPPLRRALAPVYGTGALAVVVTALALIAQQVAQGAVAARIGLASTATIALLPWGFLAGLVRVRLARAAVGDLVIELGRALRPGAVRDAIARALGDPGLSLSYAREEGGGWVDLAGAPAEPRAAAGRTVTVVEHDGRRVAAVVHDTAVDPGLAGAAFAAAGLALENERLQAELRARLQDLTASRARIVQAGDVERRRLERNLHDGAQQRLVSVTIALGLAQAGLGGEQREAVAAAQREVAGALADLRDLARGIHPAILTDQGLGPALDALAGRAPVPVELDVTGGRLPASVEAAVYYVVAEAVTNAVKYAGAEQVRVSVRGDEDGEEVEVVVADDGRGGADPAAGSGLRGLADRVEALGGRLRVHSPAGAGTTVTAVLPCG